MRALSCPSGTIVFQDLLKAVFHDLPHFLNQGKSTLYRAVVSGSADVVELLLTARADPSSCAADVLPHLKSHPAIARLLTETPDSNSSKKLVPSKNICSAADLPLPWPRLARILCTAPSSPAATQPLLAPAVLEQALQSRPIPRPDGISTEGALPLSSPETRLLFLASVLDSTGVNNTDKNFLDAPVDVCNGACMLWLASSAGGFAPVVQFLLDKKADPDRAQSSGISPLMQACFSGNVEVVELLLAHKACPSLHTKLNKTALDFCREEAGLKESLARRFRDELAVFHRAEEADASEDDARLLNQPSRASAEATVGLKALTLDQIRDQSPEYQELIAQRDMADVLGIS